MHCKIHLSHTKDGAREMYNSRVQANFRVPQLDKDMKEARLKWVDLARERTAMAAEVKKVPQLEAKMDELKQTISKLHNVH